MQVFALKGNLVFSKSLSGIAVLPDSYLVCSGKKIAGVFPSLPEEYLGIPVVDCGQRLIIPGLIDLHVHASQFSVRGVGNDLSTEERLIRVLLPEEANYYDIWYAERMYRNFVKTLTDSATTRACIFATVHTSATMFLMDLLDQSGLHCMVGKVNMDQNCMDTLREADAEQALRDTREWIVRCLGRYSNTEMILTPRFLSFCSDALIQGLVQLQRETGLPVQSNYSLLGPDTIWKLGLGFDDIGHISRGLTANLQCRMLLAHCVHSMEHELRYFRDHNVTIAHCPHSSLFNGGGIAPLRRFLDLGLSVGLGTDIGISSPVSMFRAIADTMFCSKMRHNITGEESRPITFSEAFYLATRGGGSFFGKVGAFEAGYEFDALVIDDRSMGSVNRLTLEQRLERIVHHGDDRNIVLKYVAGRKVKEMELTEEAGG